jgi:GST-like protein
MIKFYYNLAPNPTKVALCLEEMGLKYELVPVDTRKGDQHKPEFLAINPNAKVPAIVSPRRPASSCPARRSRRAARCCRG